MENADKALIAASLSVLERQSRMVVVVCVVALLMVVAVVIGGVVAHNITLDKILNADITTEATTTTTTHELNADHGSSITGSQLTVGGKP